MCGSKSKKYLDSITTDYGPLKTLTISGNCTRLLCIQSLMERRVFLSGISFSTLTIKKHAFHKSIMIEKSSIKFIS